MTELISVICKFFETAIALFLAAMVVMVFGNVVLRYGFDSGIAVSEEVSRWLFVWMTFLGAVVALQGHEHLGVDMVVDRLPDRGKKACLVLGHLVMLAVTWWLFDGSWTQIKLNIDVGAPSTDLPMAILYLPGAIFSVMAGLILLNNLWRALTGQLKRADLVMVQASEETAQMEEILEAAQREQQAELAAKPGGGRA